jgi:2-polyprenyl-3-methyl-5-hydroxy-6-metoxy-1,4-benzoquinol methylase
MFDNLETLRKYLYQETVLDIGCVGQANGLDNPHHVFTRINRDYTSYATGIDINSEGIKILQGRGYNVKDVSLNEFKRIGKFNVVTMFNLIEHISNQGSMLDDIKLVLRPRGHLIILTDNVDGFHYRFHRNVLKRNINPEHTCVYGFPEITQLLNRHGFVIEKRFYASSETGNILYKSFIILEYALFKLKLVSPSKILIVCRRGGMKDGNKLC